MNRWISRIILLGFVGMFSSISSFSATKDQLYKINELPMYGEKIPKWMEKGNREFIEMVTEECEKQGIPISEAAIYQAKAGQNLFVKGDKLTAIKRFNQAWLLDQNCYMAFEGFAVISQSRMNLEDAVKYYQTAISLNPDEPRLYHGCGLVWLLKADHFSDKSSQPDEYRKALDLITKAARMGNAAAQKSTGNMYVRGKCVPVDFKEASYWFKLSAEQGNADSQFELGNLHRSGNGVKQDYVEAEKWFQKSADQGVPIAQYYLGQFYINGQGVGKDFEKAINLLNSAADQGLPMAQFRLGLIYEKGEFGSKNSEEAVKWYSQAARQDFIPAQVNLGLMYCTGIGIPKDDNEGVKWIHKAVDQGSARAQGTMGYMYAHGVGVEQDSIKAYMWTYIALQRGDKQSASGLKILNRDLTKKQISQATKMAKEWLEKIGTGKLSP